KDIKGIAVPARAWAALRASTIESRFEALHATDLTALVGREEECGLLLRRWAKAKTGEGHVVLLSGEGGIGKSRLTAALLERLAAEPHTRLRYFCSPQHTDSALHPIIGQMERVRDARRSMAISAMMLSSVRRHQVVARRQRIASPRGQPGRNKRGQTAESRHRHSL